MKKLQAYSNYLGTWGSVAEKLLAFRVAGGFTTKPVAHGVNVSAIIASQIGIVVSSLYSTAHP